MTDRAQPSRPIQGRVAFREVRYANCWEDAEPVCAALEPLRGARCLSIASAGDNTFSLLARGAARVLAVDVNPAQLALVELKASAFRELSHESMLAFLGAFPSRSRLAVYHASLRRRLGPAARAHWDDRPGSIRDGVVHCGRLERYFRVFRRLVLPLVHSSGTIDALLAPKTREERRRFHDEVWDTWRWRAMFRLFFGRTVMGRLGRDPEFFRHVTGPVAAPILASTRRALTQDGVADNPYLRWILTGDFGEALPDYLRPERFDAIRGALDRLQLVESPVEDLLRRLPVGEIDAFNLSDVPEYMDGPAYEQLLEAALGAATRGARLVYWNLLAARRRPEALRVRLVPRFEQSQALHARARTFFYRDLVLEVAS